MDRNSRLCNPPIPSASTVSRNIQINGLSRSLAAFADDNRDCNYTATTNRIAEFLQELIEADGKIHEEEERALNEIRQIFDDNRLVDRVIGRVVGKD